MPLFQRECIARLSNEDLDAGITKVHCQNLDQSVDFLLFLAEVDRRQLYLEKGYSSLFTYLVRCFNFCETGAAQRTAACRLMRRFPMIEALLRRGEIHLTGLHLLFKHLTEENHQSILSACSVKSRTCIERYILETFKEATKRPKHDSIRPLSSVQVLAPLPASDCGKVSTDKSPAPLFAASAKEIASSQSTAEQKPVNSAAALSQSKLLRLGVTVDDSTLKDLERAKEILGAKDLGDVIAKAVKAYLKKIDPLAQEVKKSKAKEEKSTEVTSSARPSSKCTVVSRYIPVAVERQLHQESGGQCAFVSKDGTRLICSLSM